MQGHSFKQVKEILSAAPVFKFFDPKESAELQCDALDKGLGACLMQGVQPVAYASRCMTETEVNYAQIEKELLAIFFGVDVLRSVFMADALRLKLTINLWRVFSRKAYSASLSVFRG